MMRLVVLLPPQVHTRGRARKRARTVVTTCKRSSTVAKKSTVPVNPYKTMTASSTVNDHIESIFKHKRFLIIITELILKYLWNDNGPFLLTNRQQLQQQPTTALQQPRSRQIQLIYCKQNPKDPDCVVSGLVDTLVFTNQKKPLNVALFTQVFVHTQAL